MIVNSKNGWLKEFDEKICKSKIKAKLFQLIDYS